MKNLWDDLFDEDRLSQINAKLRHAQRIADRQSFGIQSEQRTREFICIMNVVRADVDQLIAKAEATIKMPSRGRKQ